MGRKKKERKTELQKKIKKAIGFYLAMVNEAAVYMVDADLVANNCTEQIEWAMLIVKSRMETIEENDGE